jgi:hypothetical protein
MKRTIRLFALAALLITGPVGCAWVELTEDGSGVRIAGNAESIEGCERLGRVTSTTRARIAGMERNDERQAEELETLARNEAAALGADTLVPASPIEDGQRVWTAYRCDS